MEMQLSWGTIWLTCPGMPPASTFKPSELPSAS